MNSNFEIILKGHIKIKTMVFKNVHVGNSLKLVILMCLLQKVFSQDICFEKDVDYKEGDLYFPYNTKSELECQKKCVEEIRCQFWTWGTSGNNSSEIKNMCFLKNATIHREKKNFFISGPRSCAGDTY